jgi:glycosyltransferase involved in cell wall biosynthesis
VRVLFVDGSISALGNLGGDGRSLLQLIRGLRAQGIDVGVCGSFPSTRLEAYASAGAIPFVRVAGADAAARYARLRCGPAGGVLTKALLARQLGPIIRRFRPDIVHVNLLQKWDGIDLRLARASGIRTVGHLRSLGTQVTVGPFDAGSCDAIVAVSDVVQRFSAERFPNVPVRRIYDPVDAGEYVSELGSSRARSRLGLPAAARPLLASVAALEPRKGHDLAIRGLAGVRDGGVPAHLVVAGAAYDVGDTRERERLGRIARDAGVLEHVTFVGNVGDMAALYAAADIVLALSHDGEALGRVPIEAALAGRPVIATAAGATPEIVAHGETGLLILPGDCHGFVEQTRRLVRNPDQVATLTRRAASHASIRFSVEQSSRELLDLYRELLAARGRLRAHATPPGSARRRASGAPATREADQHPHGFGGEGNRRHAAEFAVGVEAEEAGDRDGQ